MKTKTAIKSIREYCLECSGGSRKEATDCIIPNCQLYPYRKGKNPNRKRKGGIFAKAGELSQESAT